jgi:hypothetical protein
LIPWRAAMWNVIIAALALIVAVGAFYLFVL